MTNITEKQIALLTKLRNQIASDIARLGIMPSRSSGFNMWVGPFAWDLIAPQFAEMDEDTQDAFVVQFGQFFIDRVLLSDAQISNLEKSDASLFIEAYHKTSHESPARALLVVHQTKLGDYGPDYSAGDQVRREWADALVLTYYQKMAAAVIATMNLTTPIVRL